MEGQLQEGPGPGQSWLLAGPRGAQLLTREDERGVESVARKKSLKASWRRVQYRDKVSRGPKMRLSK